MRHIILISILLGVPLVAGAQDEAQGTQSQSAQDQQQTPQTQEAATQQQDQTQDQQSQESDSAFGESSQTVSAEAGAEGEAEAEAARAQFTSNVQDREPVDEVSEYEVSGEPLYFFTEIENGAGQTITHRWLRDGEVQAEVPLEVGSDSWRTWSSKELTPELDGEWTVEVVDAQGNTLTEESITVESSGAQSENVDYSPEEEMDESATMEETSTEGETATTEETGATSEDDGMQSDAQPEEIEYEQDSETQAQDPMQDEDAQQDDSTGDDY